MKFFALIAVLGLAVFLVFQHQGLRQLRAENLYLSTAQAEAAQLKGDLSIMETWQDVSIEISNLQAQNHELPKLRNEVRELREQQQELDQLRAENARLNGLAQRASIPAGGPPPFLANLAVMSKDSLTNAGFASPEATVQTYFWSIREVNEKLWMGCLTPQAVQLVTSQSTNDVFSSMLKQNANVTGYILRGRQSQSVDRAELSVFGILDLSSATAGTANSRQAEFGRIAFQLRLKKIARDWKIDQ